MVEDRKNAKKLAFFVLIKNKTLQFGNVLIYKFRAFSGNKILANSLNLTKFKREMVLLDLASIEL